MGLECHLPTACIHASRSPSFAAACALSVQTAMMKIIMLCLAFASAAAFAPVAPARAVAVQSRADSVVMGAKKGRVNPALFKTGITAKTVTRGGPRKGFKDGVGAYRGNDGSWKGLKPWVAGQKAENAKVSKYQSLAGSLGNKEGRGGGAGIFFLGGGRSR